MTSDCGMCLTRFRLTAELDRTKAKHKRFAAETNRMLNELRAEVQRLRDQQTDAKEST